MPEPIASIGATIGIVGGSGFYSLYDETITARLVVDTPFSKDPVTLYKTAIAESNGQEKTVLFLPRHGASHQTPPHQINYRANLWAMKESGVNVIFASNVVGGINADLPPGTLAIPTQLIDYTWGREHTFFDSFTGGLGDTMGHVDFTNPFDDKLVSSLIKAVQTAGYSARQNVVYGCTQGPRLETAAEIRRLQQDGCDIVGMTGMPEAALARELDIPYAALTLVVNWAAGMTDSVISFKEISTTMDSGIVKLKKILCSAVEDLT